MVEDAKKKLKAKDKKGALFAMKRKKMVSADGPLDESIAGFVGLLVG